MLSAIRVLLIKEHCKFFQKKFYKLEEPFIGKQIDVLNKMAVASLFRGDETDAVD